MGIVGSTLIGVSTTTGLDNFYTFNWNALATTDAALWFAGAILAGLGWTIFSLALPGIIAFWILYGLSGGPKGAMNKVRMDSLTTVAIKL